MKRSNAGKEWQKVGEEGDDVMIDKGILFEEFCYPKEDYLFQVFKWKKGNFHKTNSYEANKLQI